MNPDIGVHLATLNLFRESDGSLQITVAGASEDMREEYKNFDGIPIEYIEKLIIKAAKNMEARHNHK